jgi:hypothetical protein
MTWTGCWKFFRGPLWSALSRELQRGLDHKETTSLKSLRAFHDASSDNLRIAVGANDLIEDSTQKRLI